MIPKDMYNMESKPEAESYRYKCPICNDTGWEKVTKNGKEFVVRCKCYWEGEKALLVRNAKIPTRYRHCTVDNYNDLDESQHIARVAALKFVNEYPGIEVGLLFMGPCGVGKTHLAIGMIKKLITEKNVPCLFCDFRELMKEIKKTYGKDRIFSEYEVLEPVLTKTVLVLDELGGEKTTPWTLDILMYIVNTRYNMNRMTIFTCNFLDKSLEGEESLTDRIGYRLRSRLYEMCKLVYIQGEDYRKHIRSAEFHF